MFITQASCLALAIVAIISAIICTAYVLLWVKYKRIYYTTARFQVGAKTALIAAVVFSIMAGFRIGMLCDGIARKADEDVMLVFSGLFAFGFILSVALAILWIQRAYEFGRVTSICRPLIRNSTIAGVVCALLLGYLGGIWYLYYGPKTNVGAEDVNAGCANVESSKDCWHEILFPGV